MEPENTGLLCADTNRSAEVIGRSAYLQCRSAPNHEPTV
ncbi:mCG147017 [Mus musculus]|nr:mCG147017 [Mus musculus]